MEEELDEIYKENRNKRQIKRRNAKIILLFFLISYIIPKTEMSKKNETFDETTLTILEQKSLYDSITKQIDSPSAELKEDVLIVLSAAMRNENLTEEERNNIYRLASMLEDNPYLDENQAFESLKNLDILYRTNENPYVLGQYTYKDGEIEIFYDDSSHQTLYHELIHCIYSNENTKQLPAFLVEGVTELLANEYFSSKPFLEENSYPFEVAFIKVLCNIVTPEKILETYSTGNMEILRNKLAKVFGTSKQALELLEVANQIFTEYESNKIVSEDNMNRLLTYLDTYYREKSESNPDDLDEYLYYRDILAIMSMENSEGQYLHKLLTGGCYIKVYFSKKLREQYRETRLVSYMEAWDMTQVKASEYYKGILPENRTYNDIEN